LKFIGLTKSFSVRYVPEAELSLGNLNGSYRGNSSPQLVMGHYQ